MNPESNRKFTYSAVDMNYYFVFRFMTYAKKNLNIIYFTTIYKQVIQLIFISFDGMDDYSAGASKYIQVILFILQPPHRERIPKKCGSISREH